jgi:hypothetical protein
MDEKIRLLMLSALLILFSRPVVRAGTPGECLTNEFDLR